MDEQMEIVTTDEGEMGNVFGDNEMVYWSATDRWQSVCSSYTEWLKRYGWCERM
jgi:hypothetical protein